MWYCDSHIRIAEDRNTSSTSYQAGVIAYRVAGGRMKILLITSRDTKRWIIPKGNIEPGKTAVEAAKMEAYEEAGLRGEVTSDLPLGFYMYFKRKNDGTQVPVSVEVYLLRVDKELKKWPEKGQRKLRWYPLAEAVQKIEEPAVVPLLTRLMELEKGMIGAGD